MLELQQGLVASMSRLSVISVPVHMTYVFPHLLHEVIDNGIALTTLGMRV